MADALTKIGSRPIRAAISRRTKAALAEASGKRLDTPELSSRIERICAACKAQAIFGQRRPRPKDKGGAPAQLSRSGPGLRLRQMDNGQSSGWQCPQLPEPLEHKPLSLHFNTTVRD
jgi:hypothetical protein